MFCTVDHPEPSPAAALELVRARLRADHLAELAVLEQADDLGDLGWVAPNPVAPVGAVDGVGAERPAGGSTAPAGDPVAEALAIIDAALQADPGLLPDAALDARVVACAGLADRAKALLAVTVGAWAPRGGWLEGFPVSSAAAWLDHETGMARPDAQRVLATGRVIAEHPVVADAVRSGRLSCRKAEVLGSLPGRGRDELFARDVEVLVDAMAEVDRFESVTTIARRWKALADDEAAAADAGAAHDQRSFHHSQVGGRWKTNGAFDLADGATFDAALRAAMDPPDAPDVPGGPRTLAQRKADAAVRLAECWLARHNQDHPARPVPSATIHLTPDAVSGTSADGFDPATVCDLVPGGPVPRATAQQLLCDSVVGRLILDAEGEVIDLGRTKRLFSPAQRRAMIARDGPFCVMGSGTPAGDCQAHHLDFFTDGGRTDLADGAHISKPIHHAIHHRGFTLARLEPGVYQLAAPDGRVWTSRITGWGTSVTTNF